MARYIFPAGSVTSTGTRQRLVPYLSTTDETPETEIAYVRGATETGKGRQSIVTDESGAYTAFVGPEGASTLLLERPNGTRISVTSSTATTDTTPAGSGASASALAADPAFTGTYAAKAGATYTGAHDFTGATVTGISGGGGATVTLDADGTLVVDGTTVEMGTDAEVAAAIAAAASGKVNRSGDTYTGAHNFGGATVSGIAPNLTDRGDWAPTTVYAAGDLADVNGYKFLCKTGHTSGAAFSATNWTLISRGKLSILEGRDMWTFGHSYMSGTGGQSPAKSLFGRHNMANYSTRAAPGTTAGQMSDQVRQVALSGNGSAGAALFGTNALMSLVNDVNGSIPTATTVEAYRATFAQLTGLRVATNTGSFVFGSGWSSGVTTTAGSYFDYAFSGDTAYLLMAFTTGAAVSMTISRSGSGGATWGTVNTGAYAYAFPGAIKLSGFGPGYHTVRVTLTSGAGATVYYGLIQNPRPQTILWCKEGDLAAYSAGQNTSLTSTYPAAISAILADFPTVVPVDAGAAWDKNTMLYYDGVHLNDKGAVHWANRMEDELLKLGWRDGQNVYPNGASPAYTPLPAANYSASTLDVSATYSNLKVWASDTSWVYAMDGNFPIVPVGSGLVVTGGSGWTPGAKVITNVSAAFGSPDGPKNMYQFGSSQSAFAAAGTAGGAGYLTI